MLTIIADHPSFLLLDKPPGLACHRDEGGESVLDLVRAQTGMVDLHLVHRLDKVTSGLLLLAKGAQAARELARRFADRKMQKFYLAVSDRRPKKKQGAIVGDMSAARNGSWKLLLSRNDPAITQFFSAGTGDGGRLFLLRPLTGRTHQLRVALKTQGSPILGDERYGGSAADRVYLHAFALAFDFNGESFCFTCAPSIGEYWQRPDLITLLQQFDVPWDMVWPRI